MSDVFCLQSDRAVCLSLTSRRHGFGSQCWVAYMLFVTCSGPSILAEKIGQDESLLFEMCQMGSNECLSFYVAKVSVYTHKAGKHAEEALRFQKPRLQLSELLTANFCTWRRPQDSFRQTRKPLLDQHQRLIVRFGVCVRCGQGAEGDLHAGKQLSQIAVR